MMVQFMQGLFLTVNPIQILNPSLQALMRREIKQVPVKAPCM